MLFSINYDMLSSINYDMLACMYVFFNFDRNDRTINYSINFRLAKRKQFGKKATVHFFHSHRGYSLSPNL